MSEIQSPTKPGWYAYSGGAQTMIFLLTSGQFYGEHQWYVIFDNGESSPCEWGYIEQALSTWDLVPLDPRNV